MNKYVYQKSIISSNMVVYSSGQCMDFQNGQTLIFENYYWAAYILNIMNYFYN